MKYIDSEKLIAEIERQKRENLGSPECVCDDILSFITSLQQEQPMPDSIKLIELWHEDKEILKEMDFRDDAWRLAYNAFMCGFGRGLAVKQEQPEVDLKKEVKSYIKHNFTITDEVAQIPEEDRRYSMWEDDIRAFAKHFYKLGLNARKED